MSTAASGWAEDVCLDDEPEADEDVDGEGVLVVDIEADADEGAFDDEACGDDDFDTDEGVFFTAK
jgi:hypothetical protein